MESRITPATVGYAGGLLTISGTAAGDSVVVAVGATSTNIKVNNISVGTVTGTNSGPNAIMTIDFNGAGGGQTLTITGNGPVLNAINFTGGNSNLVINANALPTGGTLTVDVDAGVTPATLTFGATNVFGNLTVQDVNAVTQTAAKLTVSGTATITTNTPAADDITLNSAGNTFGTLVLTADAVSVTEVGDTNLGDTSANTLTLNSTGNVTDAVGATITVAGATTITAPLRNITLDSLIAALPVNTFGDLTLTGSNITINENAATTLAAVTAAGPTTGALTVTSVGSITDTGAGLLTVAGNTTLSGTSIILDTPIGVGGGNTFGTLLLNTAGAATIIENAATNFGTSVVGGILTVTSAGAITDTGAVDVTGTTILQTNGAITLDTATNNFSTLTFNGRTVASTGNVTLVDEDGIILGSSVANGTPTTSLTVTAGGVVDDTDAGTLTISGKTTISAVGFDIFLDDDNAGAATGTFGSLFLKGANVRIRENAATDLGMSLITGDLDVISAGAITNGTIGAYATITVVGTTTFNAGVNNITIMPNHSVYSSFGANGATPLTATNPLILTGGAITIVEKGGTLLGDVSATSLNLIALDGVNPALGGISQVGGTTLSVTGLATFDAGATYDINLTTGTNNFGSLIFSARDVSITEGSATLLNHRTSTSSTRGSTAYRNLNLTSTGTITQTPVVAGTFGKLTVAGNATLSGTSITLDRVDPISVLVGAPNANANSFGVLLLTSAGAVSILESGPTILGATGGALGSLTVTSSGPISDSGILQVTGATILNAGTSNNIVLDSNTGGFAPVPTNVLAGPISMTGKSLILQNDAVTVLGAITTGGTFDVNSTGNVTNPLLLVSVGGKATIRTSGDTVDLGTTLASSFGGISVLGSSDVTITESNATDLGTTNPTGFLLLTSGGNVTDSGTVTVGTTTSIYTSAGITLNSAANNFVGDFDFNNAPAGVIGSGNVTIVDSAGGIEFGTSRGSTLTVTAVGGDVTDDGAATLTISGGVSITAIGNDIELDEAANTYGTLTLKGASAVIVDAGALTLGPTTILSAAGVPGPLTLTSGGNLTQTGSVTAGATTLTAGAFNISLNTGTNNRFGTLVVVSGVNVAITEVDAMAIGDINITGNLTLIAGGAMTQVAGDIDALDTTLTAVGKNITVQLPGNSFDTLVLTGSNIAIDEDDAATDLGATTATGTLTVDAAGTIDDSGALNVTGLATFTAAGNNVILDGTNAFGSISVTSAANVEINESNSTVLATTTATGSLEVTSGGSITDTGVITVGTTTMLTATGDPITLNSAANDFTGTVDFDGSNVTIVDASGLSILVGSVATGTLSLTSTAGAGVTTTGAITGTGATTINAAGQVITLNGAFGALSLTGGVSDVATGEDVTVTDTDGTTVLATSAIGGDFILNASGTVSQTGVVTTGTGAGDIFDINGASSVTLTNASNVFGTLEIAATTDVAITEANAIVFGTTSADNLTATSTAGTITQTGTITQGNAFTTTLTAIGAGAPAVRNITLADPSNVLGTLVIKGNDVTIEEDGGTNLGNSTVTGFLDIDTTGNATDSAITGAGLLKVTGTTTLNTGTATITLTNLASTFGADMILTAIGASFADNGAVDLGASTIGAGGLTILYNGPVTDSGIVSVTGDTSITPIVPPNTIHSITLDIPSLSGAIDLTGHVVSLTNAVDTELRVVTVTSTLAVTALAGDITQPAGKITVTGVSAFTATTSVVGINLTATDFSTVTLNTDQNVFINEDDEINLGLSTVTGNLAINSFLFDGAITDSGSLSIGGTTTLDAGLGSITLDNAGSTFGPAVPVVADLILTGSSIYVKDSGPVLLGAINAGGNLTILSGLGVGDDITQVVGTVITTTAGFANFYAGLGNVNLPEANVWFTILAIPQREGHGAVVTVNP